MDRLKLFPTQVQAYELNFLHNLNNNNNKKKKRKKKKEKGNRMQTLAGKSSEPLNNFGSLPPVKYSTQFTPFKWPSNVKFGAGEEIFHIYKMRNYHIRLSHK